MKKIIFGVLMVFLTFSAFAQNWSLGGEIHSVYYNKWDNSLTSGEYSRLYFGVSFGRYFTEKISAGIMGAFDLGTVEYWDNVKMAISVGPFFQYDFLKYKLFSFGFSGSVLYEIYNKSYWWNEHPPYDAVDAQGISLNGSLLFNFTPSKNIELYMGLLSIGYGHYWVILRDSDLKHTRDSFVVTSFPASNIKLGIKFKF